MAVAVLFLFVHVLISGYVFGETDSELKFDHVLYTEEYEIEGDLEDSLLVKRLASVPLEGLQESSEVPFSGTVRASGKVVMLGHFGIDDIFGIPMLPQPPMHHVAPPSPINVISQTQSTVCPTCGTKCPTSCTNCPNCGTTTSTPSIICPRCGVQCPTCSTNCPSCGTSIAKQSTTCPNCGANCSTCGMNCLNCGARIGNPGPVCSNCGTKCERPGITCQNCGAECPQYRTTVPFSGLVPASGKVTIAADFNDNGLDQLFQRQNGNPTNLPNLCPNQKLCRVPVHGEVTTIASFDNYGRMVEYKSAPSTMIPQMPSTGLLATHPSSASPQSNCPSMKIISPAPCKSPSPPSKSQHYPFMTLNQNPQISTRQFAQPPHMSSSRLPDLPQVNPQPQASSTSVKSPQIAQAPQMWSSQLSDLPRVNLPQSTRPIAQQSTPIYFERTPQAFPKQDVQKSQMYSPEIAASPTSYQQKSISIPEMSSENTGTVSKPQLTPMNVKPTYNQLPTYLPSPYNKIPLLLEIPPLSFPWGVFQVTTLPGVIPSHSAFIPGTYFAASSVVPPSVK